MSDEISFFGKLLDESTDDFYIRLAIFSKEEPEMCQRLRGTLSHEKSEEIDNHIAFGKRIISARKAFDHEDQMMAEIVRHRAAAKGAIPLWWLIERLAKQAFDPLPDQAALIYKQNRLPPLHETAELEYWKSHCSILRGIKKAIQEGRLVVRNVAAMDPVASDDEHILAWFVKDEHDRYEKSFSECLNLVVKFEDATSWLKSIGTSIPEWLFEFDKKALQKESASLGEIKNLPKDSSLLTTIAALLDLWPKGKPPSGKELEKAAQARGLKIRDQSDDQETDTATRPPAAGIQISALAAFSEIPKKRLMRRCCF